MARALRGAGSPQNSGSAAGLDPLAIALGDLARDLARVSDPATVLQHVVSASVRLVPGATDGSITVVTGRRRVVSRAPSSPLPAVVDALQEATQQGPCLDAAYEHRTVRVPDLAAEARWPDFAPAAHRAGARSMLCLQLFVDGDDLGALNLHSRRPGAFTDVSEHVGLLVAAHAAIAFSAATRLEHLESALDSRDVIGQAKGILVERHRISGQQAFQLLHRHSTDHNVKLRDVAEQLVTTGTLEDR